MTTEEQKTKLLEEFQSYLQQSQPELLASGQPDLHTLLAELTGLKAEVQAESRHYKHTLDTLSSAVDTLQEDNKTLSAELAASTERFKQLQADKMRAMLLEMIDLYDRLQASAGVLQNYHPVNSLFKHSRKKDVRFIGRFTEGQEMTLRRFEELLHRYQVRAIECIGRTLDPEVMTAIATGENTELANGIVLEELRKGFIYHDQVLRLAEVKVNKIKLG